MQPFGRIFTRVSGSFLVGKTDGVSWKYCRVISKADGYAYSLEKSVPPTTSVVGFLREVILMGRKISIVFAVLLVLFYSTAAFPMHLQSFWSKVGEDSLKGAFTIREEDATTLKEVVITFSGSPKKLGYQDPRYPNPRLYLFIRSPVISFKRELRGGVRSEYLSRGMLHLGRWEVEASWEGAPPGSPVTLSVQGIF